MAALRDARERAHAHCADLVVVERLGGQRVEVGCDLLRRSRRGGAASGRSPGGWRGREPGSPTAQRAPRVAPAAAPLRPVLEGQMLDGMGLSARSSTSPGRSRRARGRRRPRGPAPPAVRPARRRAPRRCGRRGAAARRSSGVTDRVRVQLVRASRSCGDEVLPALPVEDEGLAGGSAHLCRRGRRGQAARLAGR